MKNSRGRYKLASDALLMILGATLTAAATKYIFDPAGLDTGGISGLSIAIRYLAETRLGRDIPLWVSTLVLNIPIFLLAIRINGIHTVLRTGFAWLVMTVELMLLPERSFVADNMLLTCIYGGIFFGAGSGFLMQAHSSSGGTDLLAIVLHAKMRDITQGRLLQYLDGAIVLLGVFVFGIERTLYAIISVFIMGKVIDVILSRGKSAKMATIISDEADAIAKEILTVLDRGITALPGRGMYSGKEKTVLFCICSARDIVLLKDIVKKHDEKAFFVVGQVSEAMGEGFLENWNAED